MIRAAFCAITFIAIFSAGLAFGQDDLGGADTTGTGFVRFALSTDTLLLVIDEDFSQPRVVASNDTLELQAGLRQFRMASRHDVDIVFSSLVRQDTVSGHSIHLPEKVRLRPEVYLERSAYPRLFWDANLAVATEPDATIFVDGVPVGSGLVFLTLADGPHRIEMVGDRSRRHSARVEIADHRLAFLELYARPDRRKARLLAVLPGASQFYQGRPIAGAAFSGMATAGIVGAILSHGKLNRRLSTYEETRADYRRARNEIEAFEQGEIMEAAFRDALDAQRTRNILAGVTASVFAINIIESFRRPRQGFRRPYDLQADLLPFFGQPGISLGIQRNF